MAALVPDTATRVLDVGCGNGGLGAWLKSKRLMEADGVTYSEEEAVSAALQLNQVFVADLNSFAFSKIGGHYNCIICSHLLEHLYEPWSIISKLELLLKPGGTLIIAFPNLLFFKQRWQLFRGRFRYSEHCGLMDITHFRFFNWQTCNMLLRDCSLTLEKKWLRACFPSLSCVNYGPLSAVRLIGLW